jgi:hypothetical protein
MTTHGAYRLRHLPYLAVLLSTILILAAAGTSAASPPAPPGSAGPAPVSQTGTGSPGEVESVALAGPLLSYQGRLLDLSGNPKPDGNYTMSFSLYNVETSGSPLWTETKSISLKGGLFSTLLGDTTAFNLTIFSGQALWLGITVVGDPEATPRIQVAYAPYALYTSNADLLDGQHAAAFAAATHAHAGEQITSGTVADARIASTIARDAEIMPAVLGADGAGSTLDADLLDGQHSGGFAAATHNHDAAYVNVTGDTMSGVLTVPRIAYSAPRTQYFVVGGEGFVPGSNVPYVNTYGNGGAYIVSGSGALVAPLNLPHGAKITEFKVFFYDVSASDMVVSIDGQGMSGGYFTMAQVSSAGISGYGSSVTSSIQLSTIDNFNYCYSMYAWTSAWDSSNLKIKGVLITYTLSEAQ